MRIIILTVDHVYANKAVKELIAEFRNEIVLIVDSGVFLNNESLIGSVLTYFKISGFNYVVSQIAKLVQYKIAAALCTTLFPSRLESKFYLKNGLAKKNRISVIKLSNINSKKTERLLRKLKPDLVVSVFFNQILKKKIIAIPKKGVINIHPAYLPDYKGVSPVFWALSNGEKSTGVSVHFIDEGIDSGRIISRKKIRISKTDTEDSLYWRCVIKGCPLLISAIKNIKTGNLNLIRNKGGRYYSLPSRDSVSKFLQEGRSFFRIKEYLYA